MAKQQAFELLGLRNEAAENFKNVYNEFGRLAIGNASNGITAKSRVLKRFTVNTTDIHANYFGLKPLT